MGARASLGGGAIDVHAIDGRGEFLVDVKIGFVFIGVIEADRRSAGLRREKGRKAGSGGFEEAEEIGDFLSLIIVVDVERDRGEDGSSGRHCGMYFRGSDEAGKGICVSCSGWYETSRSVIRAVLIE